MNVHMKTFNRYVGLLLVAAMSVFTSSCSDDEEQLYPMDVDYFYNVTILLRDSQGNNLLDPENPDNIIGQDITLVNGEETFDVAWHKNETTERPESRSLIFRSLAHCLVYMNPSNQIWALCMYHIEADRNFDTTLVLKCNDKRFNIRMKNVFERESIYTMGKGEFEIYLDDKPCTGHQVVITL